MNERLQNQATPNGKRNRVKRPASQSQSQGAKGIDSDLNLNALNLLIEMKVDNGVKELKKKFWPYTLILIAIGGVGIWGLFKGITDDIQKRLTSAYVTDTLNEHIRKFTDEKVASVADGRISVAEERIIDGFEKKVVEQKSMLAKSSAAAEAQIQSLQSSLEVMKKAYDARGGSRRAFDEIAILATNRTDAGEIATRVIREIDASYADRMKEERVGFIGVIRHTLTYNGSNGKRGPISLGDASRLVALQNRDFEEGAINRLADSGQKEFVDFLIQSVEESDRLDTVYTALRGIEKLTGASFPALGISEVKKWWELNKDNPEYHSPYKTVWTILLHDQLESQPNESDSDYYKRVVIPLHAAIVAKPDLENVAKTTLPLAYALGLSLKGKVDGVDFLAIIKDLISRLGDDPDSRRMAFRYTINTMLLYENTPADTLLKYLIRSIRVHPEYLDEFMSQETFKSEFRKSVESIVKAMEERTKGVSFFAAINSLPNGETRFLVPITDNSGTFHKLDLLVRKDSTFVIHSANDIEVPSGEVGVINFKTDHKEGQILLLNDNGIPRLFDVVTRPASTDRQRTADQTH